MIYSVTFFIDVVFRTKDAFSYPRLRAENVFLDR